MKQGIIDEFKPTRKDNLIIIIAFVLSILIILQFILINPSNDNYIVIYLILSIFLFGIGLLLLYLKIFRLLRESGIFGRNNQL